MSLALLEFLFPTPGHGGEVAAGIEKGPQGASPSSVVSVAELFGVLATPTIIALHPEGNSPLYHKCHSSQYFCPVPCPKYLRFAVYPPGAGLKMLDDSRVCYFCSLLKNYEYL